jgi:hypothetical protein
MMPAARLLALHGYVGLAFGDPMAQGGDEDETAGPADTQQRAHGRGKARGSCGHTR